jgi:hypothetical protein
MLRERAPREKVKEEVMIRVVRARRRQTKKIMLSLANSEMMMSNRSALAQRWPG